MKIRALLTCVLLTACGDDRPADDTDATQAIDAAIDADPAQLTDEERAVVATLSPLPALPADPSNAYADQAAAARLGQMLFFDKSYSGPLVVGDNGSNGGLGRAGDAGKVACASCHGVGSATLDDHRTTPNHISLGTNLGTRNAPGMVNSSYQAWTNWGGRFDSQWSLPLAVSENAAIMRSTRLQVAHLLQAKYRAEYDAAFPVPLDAALDPAAADAARFPPSGRPKAAATDPDGPWELMTEADRQIVLRIWVNYGKALAAYTRTLISRDAPFDRFAAGDDDAISRSARRGLRTFLAACAGCHAGPAFTDGRFHALGVPQTGAGVPATDLGRFQDVPALLASPFNSDGPWSDDRATGRLAGLAQADAQRGAFRTPGLRGVATSAPYMHAGQLATLEDVVAFYDAGGGEVAAGVTKDPLLRPLGLSGAEKADLVAFLHTLTGAPVPAARLADTSR